MQRAKSALWRDRRKSLDRQNGKRLVRLLATIRRRDPPELTIETMARITMGRAVMIARTAMPLKQVKDKEGMAINVSVTPVAK